MFQTMADLKWLISPWLAQFRHLLPTRIPGVQVMIRNNKLTSNGNEKNIRMFNQKKKEHVSENM